MGYFISALLQFKGLKKDQQVCTKEPGAKHKDWIPGFANSACLNDQAYNCLIHFYKRCVSELCAGSLRADYVPFFRTEDSPLNEYVITCLSLLKCVTIVTGLIMFG